MRRYANTVAMCSSELYAVTSDEYVHTYTAPVRMIIAGSGELASTSISNDYVHSCNTATHPPIEDVLLSRVSIWYSGGN